MPMTPETLKLVVESRLVQTFRQYPRAGLNLSSSCRNTLLKCITDRVFMPENVGSRMMASIDADKWTLQARLAWMDLANSYAAAYSCGFDAQNLELLRAISDAILSAGGIPQGDNVPVRQLPESKAAE